MAGQSLLNLRPQDDRSSLIGCSQKGVETCVRADLDINLLKTGDSIKLPDGTKLRISRRGQFSAVFKVIFYTQIDTLKNTLMLRMAKQKLCSLGRESMLLDRFMHWGSLGGLRVVVTDAFFG